MLINGTTTGTPIDFFPEANPRIRSDPYKRLGASILIQAIKDACSQYSVFDGGYTKKGACEFLLKDTVDFPLWCVGLGLDPILVRAKLHRIIQKAETRRLLKEFEHHARNP